MVKVREAAKAKTPARSTRRDDTTVLRDGTKATRATMEALVAADLARRAAEHG